MNFYLSNSLGFFLQLAPCALMIFLPFPEEALRFSRRRILAGAAVFSLALAALFPLTLLPFPTFYGMGNLIMLFAVMLVLAGFVWLVREDLTKKMLVFCVVLFYAVTQYWLVNSTRIVLPETLLLTSVAYSSMDTLLYAATAAVTLPLMLLFVIRPMSEFIREMEPEKIRREYAITIASTTVLVAAMMFASVQNYIPSYYFVVLLLELLLILEQILIYWLLFRESLRRKRDGDRQRVLEIQRMQYENIRREMESARRFRHDLRHHLNVLGALNAQGKRSEISEYLKQYGAVYERLRQLNLSGDPVVDGILEYYLAQVRDESIPMECEVDLPGDSGLEAMDMTVLLGNCLENALAAQRKLPPEARRLRVELRAAKSMILLRIQNSCAETDDSGGPKDWKSFARRGDAGRAGVGLSSVDAIAQKYDGSALFQRKDGQFTTRVILNPKQAQE